MKLIGNIFVLLFYAASLISGGAFSTAYTRKEDPCGPVRSSVYSF